MIYFPTAVLSRFDFVYPSYMTTCEGSKIMKAVADADGDLQVTRKNNLHKKEGVVLIGKISLGFGKCDSNELQGFIDIRYFSRCMYKANGQCQFG